MRRLPPMTALIAAVCFSFAADAQSPRKGPSRVPPVQGRVLPSGGAETYGTFMAPATLGAATVNVLDYGAVGDGVADDGPAFTAACAALGAAGGTVLVPAPPAYYRISGTGGRVAAPKVICRITSPNTWVVGIGAPRIHMADWDLTDSTADHDPNGAGADAFTVFGFENTRYGGVIGLHFTGEGDGTPLQLWSARSKAVGFSDSQHMVADRLEGKDIVGVLVIARGSMAEASRDIRITNSHAQRCSENGFNFMGGTADCTFIGNVSEDNGYHGLESGCFRLTVSSNHFARNHSGFSHVGRHATVTGNVFTENRIMGVDFQYNDAHNDASRNTLSGNRIFGNAEYGVFAEPGSHDNVIAANFIANNGKPGAKGFGVWLAARTSRISVTDNWIGNDDSAELQRTGVVAAYADGHVVTGNTFSHNYERTCGGTDCLYPVVVQGTDDAAVAGSGMVVRDNIADAEVSIPVGADNVWVRNNSPRGDPVREVPRPVDGSTTIETNRAENWVLVLSDSSSYVIKASRGQPGARFSVRVVRSAAAIGTVTWDPIFKMTPWAAPAQWNTRTIEFVWEGTYWVERGGSRADFAW